MSIEIRDFGKTASGLEPKLYILTNSKGTQASFTDLGACWVTMITKDSNGNMADVIFGYTDAETYFANPTNTGETIGRNANRIKDGAFVIDGKKYQLAKNNHDRNNLHSGPDKWCSHMFEAKTEETDEYTKITFSKFSPDGEQGFPGNLQFYVSYTLTEDDELILEYEAVCDAKTVINPTNHVYFNLAGHGSGSILDHEICINADRYNPTDEYSIPTGELADVTDTPMDFRVMKPMGLDIEADFEQLKFAGGFDHNWVLNEYDGDIRMVARVEEPKTGRAMEVYTNLPGMQFYSGNMIRNLGSRKENADYLVRGAFCLETQFYPDSVNHEEWPQPIYEAGEKYISTTIYKFETL